MILKSVIDLCIEFSFRAGRLVRLQATRLVHMFFIPVSSTWRNLSALTPLPPLLLSCPPSHKDSSLSQGYLNISSRFSNNFLLPRGEKYCKSWVSCPRIQHNDPAKAHTRISQCRAPCPGNCKKMISTYFMCMHMYVYYLDGVPLTLS